MAFARDMASTYVFASDVGTLFAKKCLYKLADYLDYHTNVSACTGRQRVMNVKQQVSLSSSLFLSSLPPFPLLLSFFFPFEEKCKV